MDGGFSLPLPQPTTTQLWWLVVHIGDARLNVRIGVGCTVTLGWIWKWIVMTGVHTAHSLSIRHWRRHSGSFNERISFLLTVFLDPMSESARIPQIFLVVLFRSNTNITVNRMIQLPEAIEFMFQWIIHTSHNRYRLEVLRFLSSKHKMSQYRFPGSLSQSFILHSTSLWLTQMQ